MTSKDKKYWLFAGRMKSDESYLYALSSTQITKSIFLNELNCEIELKRNSQDIETSAGIWSQLYEDGQCVRREAASSGSEGADFPLRIVVWLIFACLAFTMLVHGKESRASDYGSLIKKVHHSYVNGKLEEAWDTLQNLPRLDTNSDIYHAWAWRINLGICRKYLKASWYQRAQSVCASLWSAPQIPTVDTGQRNQLFKSLFMEAYALEAIDLSKACARYSVIAFCVPTKEKIYEDISRSLSKCQNKGFWDSDKGRVPKSS